ncbi:DUF1800 domain-containing protein [Sphingomonas aracearum]|uniref:DUF1800 domain-containing protein n=1 Tax=Sphingomonas aracearum TaxID=2283317 RepID=A0A369W039_9SPHN|nr:DUF1800 domain-containing protein [Sphingomonas aracearum]RDE06672.1 DUF1800 domain-containing protein [Sphingomonas aracearum]
MVTASIALNRFGLGARPDEPVPGDPKRWLLDQFAAYQPRPPALAGLAGTVQIAGQLAAFYDRQARLRQEAGPRGRRATAAVPAETTPPSLPGTAQPPPAPARDALQQSRQIAQQQMRGHYLAAVGARTAAALVTPAPFAERLVHFWANHFAVSADKLELTGLAGAFEAEAIRPHVFGRFANMLNAVERHPAMLVYLDQAQSVGPDSAYGRQVAARGRRTVGLNENLAREILELHTLGVRTGYAQGDVTEFARAMTGWTVAGLRRGLPGRANVAELAPGTFVFAAALHQPGARTVLGRAYPEGGVEQAQAVLDTLAVHPATAAHVATKLARHFAGDTPPPAMIERLRAAFLKSGGDLPTVYRALIDSPEAWAPAPAKFRTPWEWSLAAYRALGLRQVQPQAAVGLLNQLGQATWRPGQPVGYEDTAGSWAGPDALMRRVEAAERFATRAGAALDARTLAPRLFPAALSPATAQAIARAESPGQGLSLLLVAPEFLRR